MSEAKHMPGPWLMVADAADGKHAIYGADEVYRIATVHNFNGWPANAANARLIAAAPELLQALIDCAEALAHLQDRMAVRVNPPTLEKARAAITKASS